MGEKERILNKTGFTNIYSIKVQDSKENRIDNLLANNTRLHRLRK